jgi:hypothetical protein
VQVDVIRDAVAGRVVLNHEHPVREEILVNRLIECVWLAGMDLIATRNIQIRVEGDGASRRSNDDLCAEHERLPPFTHSHDLTDRYADQTTLVYSLHLQRIGLLP